MLINFVLFQAGWFACVLGGAHDAAWIGLLVTLVAILVETRRVADRRRFLALVLAVTVLGGAVDAAQTAAGVLRFDGGTLPVWMVTLWALFATTLTGCMRWLQRHLLWAALLGLVAGPLCYGAGERLGALRLGEHAWWLLALEWGALTPLALALAGRLVRPAAPSATT